MKNFALPSQSCNRGYLRYRISAAHETGDPIKVEQLITVMLKTIDDEIAVTGPTSNGDVLQAVAMTLAIRSGMIHSSLGSSSALTHDLVDTALQAFGRAAVHRAPSGRA